MVPAGIIRGVNARDLPSPFCLKRVTCACAGTMSGFVSAIVLSIAMYATTSAHAQPAAIEADRESGDLVPITGRSLGGFVLPTLPLDGDVTLQALRGSQWRHDDTQRLHLTGDVVARIDDYTYHADEVVVWINRLPTDDGLVTQTAFFFPTITNPSRPSGVGVAGNRLLVTASVRGDAILDVGLLRTGRPRGRKSIADGEARLQRELRELARQLPSLSTRPRVDSPPPRATSEELPTAIAIEKANAARPWLRAPGSIIAFNAERVDLETGTDENVILASGGFVVEYFGAASDDPSQLTIRADRAVIFTEPGSIEELTRRTFDASFVRGIYLEGSVIASAERGEQVVRAPRVYYDFETGRALMVEAVLRTTSRNLANPMYARARELRQVSENRYEATDVRVSASEFAVGHLALGAKRMTIERESATDDGFGEVRPDGDGEFDAAENGFRTRIDRTIIDADAITLRLDDAPVFFWPTFGGTIREIPLRRIRLGASDDKGVEIETRWDLFSLAGVTERGPFDLEGQLDGFTDRGPAAGLTLRTSERGNRGRFDLYGMHDEGVDRTDAGRNVEPETKWRGLAIVEHDLQLDRHWRLRAQGSWISDPSFIASWREAEYRERREYETALDLTYQNNETSFDLTGKVALNDFISNGWLLASRGYTVERLPQATWRRIGDSFGGITSQFEWSASRLRFAFADETPREAGVRAAGFGLDPNDSFADALVAGGFREAFVNRFDARHELSAPFNMGIVRVVPFIVGRLTAWDDDFAEFSPQQDEKVRLWGAIGVRAEATFQRVRNDVRSSVFDLFRLRHLITPNITAWYGESDVDQNDLPVYDEAVESIANGAAIRLGLRNVWQTQRGGPGAWRSVDVLTFNTNLVLTGDDRNRESAVPRFFDFRPEYSRLSDHIHQDMIWQLSDSVSMVGEGTWDLDDSVMARASLGVEVRHSPVITTFFEYRSIDISDTELLALGWNYRVSQKYRVNLRPSWDVRENEFRSLLIQVTRRFPDYDFRVNFLRDEIRDETRIGASLDLLTF